MRIQRAGERVQYIGLGDAVRYTAPRAAAAGNGLLNNLIAFWPGNEANGDALDAHTNALHLTDTNTVTSNPGLVYATARQYTRVNSEIHVRPGDDAVLSTGDVDFTLAVWAYLDSKTVTMVQAGKASGSAIASLEYIIYYLQTSDRYAFRISTGAASALVTANTYGAPPLTTWALLCAWHDSAGNTINIQVNNGGVDSLSHATGVADTIRPFTIGGFSGASSPHDGRIGPTMFWKSAAGGGGALTAAQRTALYNGGAGLTYAQFTT